MKHATASDDSLYVTIFDTNMCDIWLTYTKDFLGPLLSLLVSRSGSGRMGEGIMPTRLDHMRSPMMRYVGWPSPSCLLMKNGTYLLSGLVSMMLIRCYTIARTGAD